MIALAAALEVERALRRAANAHVANTATPKAYDLASGLELELRKLEGALVLLSAKAGRAWEGQSPVGGPGPVVVVGHNPLHPAQGAAAALGSLRGGARSDGALGGHRRMTAAKEAEAAQHETLGRLASQLARVSAGLSNLASANDLLKELAEQQTLSNSLRVLCSASAKSLASLASPPAGASGGGRNGSGSRAAKARAGRNAARGRGGSGGVSTVGKYGKLAPVLTPSAGDDGSSGEVWSSSPPPSPLPARRNAATAGSSGGGGPFATPSGVSPGLSFRGNARGALEDESSVDLSVREPSALFIDH
jgi:hypothetical protein